MSQGPVNLQQHEWNKVIRKFWGRNYYGIPAKDNLKPQHKEDASPKKMVKASISESRVVAESVNTSGIIHWMSQVKGQLETMIHETYESDEAVQEILRNIQLEIEVHMPRSEESSEGVKEKMEDLNRSLRGFEDKIEGSLNQYISKLNDTVKTIALDTIVDEPKEDVLAGDPDGDPAGGLGAALGGMGGSTSDFSGDEGDIDGEGMNPEEELEDPEVGDKATSDFKKELSKASA